MTGTDTRKTRGKWSAGDLEKVRELASEGHSSTQIGKVFGVSRCAVVGACHRNSIKLPGANGRGVTLDSGRLKRLQKSIEKGKSQTQIAGELGISQSCVSNTIRRKNLKPRARTKQAVPRELQPDIWQSKFDRSGYKAVFAEGYVGQTGRVEIWDLDRHDCRYPIEQPGGGVRYCGKQSREGSSYCETHHARCCTSYVRNRRERNIGR